jgi:hypothetical protein
MEQGARVSPGQDAATAVFRIDDHRLTGDTIAAVLGVK